MARGKEGDALMIRSSAIIAIVLTISACASAPEQDKTGSTQTPPTLPPVTTEARTPTHTRSLPPPEDEPEEAYYEEYSMMEDLPAPAAGRRVPVTSTVPAKDYLPFIDVAIYDSAIFAERGAKLQDRYTRIQIVTLKPDAFDVDGIIEGTRKETTDTRNYDRESRNWLSRMMGSRAVTRTLVAEFNVTQPRVTATEALFSASFKSSRQEGESWSTNESIAVYATPYFKVNANTTIEAKFRLQLADERENVAPSNVLSALTTAASAIAPSSVLLTHFTAPRMEVASNFLNSAVSTLFGQTITEQSVSAFSIKTWTDQPILVVSAALPDARNIKDTDERGAVGSWAVYLDEPIPSVFTSDEGYDSEGYDAPDFSRVTAGDILAFKIGEDLTIYDYIFSRLDLADRVTDVNTTLNANTARLICTRIERGLSEIGFNSYDSAAGAWAAAESDQFTQNASALLHDPATCDAAARWASLEG